MPSAIQHSASSSEVENRLRANALSPQQTLIVWLGLGVLVWKIAVDAHNVRQAIEAPFWLGFLLALAWAVADFAFSRILFSAGA